MDGQESILSNLKLIVFEGLTYLGLVFREFCHFFYIIFSPIPLISAIIIVVLTLRLPNQTNEIQIVFSIVITLLSGLIGAIWYDRFKKDYEADFIVKKSDSSIRNLKLIKQKILSTLERIRALKVESNTRDFDEIETYIENIDKDILNSISDWMDVNLNSKLIVESYEDIENKEKQIVQLQRDVKEFEKLKEQMQSTADEKKELEKQIKDKNKEAKELRKQINQIESSTISFGTVSPSASFVNGSVLGSGHMGKTYFSDLLSNTRKCKNCGNIYPYSNIDINGYCDNCRLESINLSDLLKKS